jgi:hypothetical protein
MSFNRIQRAVEGQAMAPRFSMNSEVLAAGKTLALNDAPHQRFDPDGSTRIIVLPAVALADGSWFEILNWAGGAEDLTINDASGSTIATVSQNESCKFVCDGSAWYHMGITTIALA